MTYFQRRKHEIVGWTRKRKVRRDYLARLENEARQQRLAVRRSTYAARRLGAVL